MTREGFEACFKTFAVTQGLSNEVEASLRDYCQENWEQIEKFQDVHGLVDLLEEGLCEIFGEDESPEEEIGPDVRSKIEISYNWLVISIEVPAKRISKGFLEKIQKAAEGLDSVVLDYLNSQGIDVLAIYVDDSGDSEDEDDEITVRFKAIIEEGEQD